ncbi:histidine phosphatase family protein [Roseateles sp. DAIF2]|uniref:histidine phosphatase family protein n=1 Tax=Roseateles sp. DAIF2 TaxID=2714952 RepID=UPI0018A27CAD|nr:histidine phosphatase family protein [Roseateles sp. DAIF2]QPF71846.1 histidine phosphatase family protein [Roseateles sp. DAIF2]
MSTSPTELLLIRHGETDWNRRQSFQGQIDVPLNERGLAQALRVGERLAGERFDALVASDLIRTRQTAAPLAEAQRLAPAFSAELREQAFGILEGLSFDDIKVRHPDEFALWARHDPDYALPGGAESRRRFHERVIGALQALGHQHPGARLAVVTHGGVLDMVWRSARNLPLTGPRECPIPNAGLNRLRLAPDGRFEILAWGEDAHVRDLA